MGDLLRAEGGKGRVKAEDVVGVKPNPGSECCVTSQPHLLLFLMGSSFSRSGFNSELFTFYFTNTNKFISSRADNVQQQKTESPLLI